MRRARSTACVSQRAEQHDAHLTSLAAVAQLDDPGHASFLAVADAVRRYYPRVTAIELLSLAPAPQRLAASGAPLALDPAALADRAQSLSVGKAGVLASTPARGYALVKRLAHEPLSLLVLQIDAQRLTETDGPAELAELRRRWRRCYRPMCAWPSEPAPSSSPSVPTSVGASRRPDPAIWDNWSPA